MLHKKSLSNKKKSGMVVEFLPMDMQYKPVPESLLKFQLFFFIKKSNPGMESGRFTLNFVT